MTVNITDFHITEGTAVAIMYVRYFDDRMGAETLLNWSHAMRRPRFLTTILGVVIGAGYAMDRVPSIAT
jgi:hypothetical protein